MIAAETTDHQFRSPDAQDGAAVQRLIETAGGLDTNSLYCNLLQCSHFAETCLIAERSGALTGWVSAYVPPSQPDTLFVWQICTATQARGQGLGRRMIASILNRAACRHVRHVECTITADNAASWALFGSMGDLTHEPHFDRDLHFGGHHASEHRVRIALTQAARQAA